MHFKAEGDVEFKAVLFVPKTSPFEFYDKYYEKGSKGALKVRSTACSTLCGTAVVQRLCHVARGGNARSQVSWSREPGTSCWCECQGEAGDCPLAIRYEANHPSDCERAVLRRAQLTWPWRHSHASATHTFPHRS